MMKVEADLAIVGSGFGGSLLAMIARRLGRTVILLDRGRHPRFAIGESSTPLANLLLETLARRYDLPELLPFIKWGTWRRARPDVRCGLKRGFTFYHHRFGEAWAPREDRANELLVAASPRDEIADTHWYRADFDHALARIAVEHGAQLMEEASLESIALHSGHGVIAGRTPAGSIEVRARFVVDASGPRGFLSRALNLGETPVPGMPATQSLFCHFTRVSRWQSLHAAVESPPYPPDDAALHHVFPGGWIWVLRFAHGVTSAGVAATDALAEELHLAEGAAAWSRLLDTLPSVREQFADAKPCLEFRHQPRLAYRTSSVVGPGWALLPSAAGFVDPLLSTGFPLTLLGIERLVRRLEEDWNSPRWVDGLRAYGTVTLNELDRAASLIGGLYGQLENFEAFTSLTQLYFAAASYAETARRLGRAELAEGFLMGSHATFGRDFQQCLSLASKASSSNGSSTPWLKHIRRAIEPINVAGLADPARRNWYPARAEDLLAAATKFGPDINPATIEAMLREAG